jgi:late competence protein required for DNA uptake (superfamily II DNA/RNA helicase)
VNKNLKKIKNAEYELHDNFYTGIDRKHKFIHITCGHIFESTLYLVQFYKDPCKVCRNKNQIKRKFEKTQKELSERTKGRYVLVADDMAVSKDSKRLVQCNKCGYIWYVNISSIYSNNGGCPNCVALARWEHWHQRFAALETKVSAREKLSTSDHNWLSRNKKLFYNGKLDKEREAHMYRLLQQL